MKVELSMVDRRWFGDLCLAILIALPLVAFASPKITADRGTPASTTVNLTADRLPGNGRISLLG